MADPTIKLENKFFLARENDSPHGGEYIYTRTHLPRKFSLEDARTLAHDLLALAGEPETALTILPPQAVEVDAGA